MRALVFVSVALVTTMALGDEPAKKGHPPKAEAIPPGEGWYCTKLLEPIDGSACYRTLESCDEFRDHNEKLGLHYFECAPRLFAICFTVRDVVSDKFAPNCKITFQQCDSSQANTRKHPREWDDVSDCARMK